MGLETNNEKLLTARSNDWKYLEVRAKLFVKRLLCKAYYLKSRGLLNLAAYGQSNGSIYRNHIWCNNTDQEGEFARYYCPLSMLRIGITDIKSADLAMSARLGARIRSAVRDGFTYDQPCYSKSVEGKLFYGLAHYIYHTLCSDTGVKPHKFCPGHWQEYIHQTWIKMNKNNGQETPAVRTNKLMGLAGYRATPFFDDGWDMFD